MSAQDSRNRAQDFVDQCAKRFQAAVEQAGNDYIVRVYCSTGSQTWEAIGMAPVSGDLVTFQSSDGKARTIILAPLEQVTVQFRCTKRRSEQKQPKVNFKEIGFHTFTSLKPE